MYLKYFGLNAKPFSLTPDPRFLYLTPGHREALAQLIYGVQERKGFITLVGEVGTGKTTILNALLQKVGPMVQTAFLFNTALEVDLFGQANASRINARIYSGFGGQTDFIVGALHSSGGQSFIALRSWHPRADVSTSYPSASRL